jgi:hypothetical protein
MFARRRNRSPHWTLIAVLALLASLLSVGSPALPKAHAEEPTPVPELDSATSTTVENPDGSFTTTLYTAPVNYQGEDGDWHPISSTLVPSGEPGYDWENRANSFDSLFKGTLSDGYLRVVFQDEPFSLTASGANEVQGAVDGSCPESSFLDTFRLE